MIMMMVMMMMMMMIMMIVLNTASRWKHTHILSSLKLVIGVVAVGARYMQVRNYTGICPSFPSLGISEFPIRVSGLVLIYVMTLFNFMYYVASKNEIFFPNVHQHKSGVGLRSLEVSRLIHT